MAYKSIKKGLEEALEFANKEKLITLLKHNKVELSFTKKDGSTRLMKCTLMEDIIPSVVGNSKQHDHLITVYDLEKEAWRNINFDTVMVHDVG